MIIKILRTLIRSKLKFFSPKKVDVVIFDDIGSDLIKQCLPKCNFSTLKTRVERIDLLFLSLRVFFWAIIYFRGNLLTSYLISIIKIQNPKIVVTYIDNSLKFSEVALKFKKIKKNIKFIAIQNGARYEILENNYLFKKKIVNKNQNKKYYLPIFLSFGNYEKKLYKKLNIKINKNIPVGRPILENYINFKKKNNVYIKKKKQICLLSDHGAWDPRIQLNDVNLERNFVMLTKFCLKFSKKYNYKILICQKRIKQKKVKLKSYHETDFYKEEKAFKKYLDKKSFLKYKKYLFKRNKKKYQSYLLMDQSEVVISTMSTMLRENLVLKNKILAANLTGQKIYNFPIKKLISFNSSNYLKFEKKLLSILKISKLTYHKKIEKEVHNLLSNKQSPTEKIYSVIQNYL